MFAITGVMFEISSYNLSGRSMPKRPATALRWMMAFVEPPIAMFTRIAFSIALRVMILSGVRFSRTMATIRAPLRSAISLRRESAAGMLAQPVNVMPIASARLVIVDAVPITMQWPVLRDMQLSSSHHSSSLMRPARSSSQ